MWRQRKCVHCFGMKVKSVANPKKAKFDVIYSISIIHGYYCVWNLHYTSELCIHSAEVHDESISVSSLIIGSTFNSM